MELRFTSQETLKVSMWIQFSRILNQVNTNKIAAKNVEYHTFFANIAMGKLDLL